MTMSSSTNHTINTSAQRVTTSNHNGYTLTRSPEFAAGVKDNASRQCKADGCTNGRHYITGHCRLHGKYMYKYGHPHGRTILATEYAKEKQEVRDLITKNLTHKATVTALEFINTWLTKALNNEPTLAAREMYRLATQGLTPLEVLIESSAVFLFSERNPKTLPPDLPLSYAMAIAVFRLRPQSIRMTSTGVLTTYKPKGSDRRAFGETLRKSLYLYFTNICNSISRKQQQDYEFRTNLYTPLDITPTQEDMF